MARFNTLKEELNFVNMLSDASVPINTINQNVPVKSGRWNSRLWGKQGQMEKILLQETICVSGKETDVLHDRASNPGIYEAVVEITKKYSIYIWKHHVLRNLQ